MPELPRTALGREDYARCGVRELPREREQGDGASCVDRGWLPDLPSPARAEWRANTARMRDLSRTRHPAGAACRSATQSMRDVPHLPPPTPSQSRDVHDGVSHGPQEPPTNGTIMQRMPRLRSLSARSYFPSLKPITPDGDFFSRRQALIAI
jgi:hypothetical protein